MISFSKLILLVSFLLVSSVARSDELLSRLKARNNLFLKNEAIRPILNDEVVKSRLARWIGNPNVRNYMVDCTMHFKSMFRSSNILSPVCYYLRNDSPAVRKNALKYIEVYVLELHAALVEIGGDPFYSKQERSRAYRLANKIPQDFLNKIDVCLAPAYKAIYAKNDEISYTPFSAVNRCFHSQFEKVSDSPIFAINLTAEFSGHSGQVISPVGWTAGNKVDYLFENDTSVAEQTRLDSLHSLVPDRYPLAGAGSYAAMAAKDHRSVFTKEEGFFSTTGATSSSTRRQALKKSVKPSTRRRYNTTSG